MCFFRYVQWRQCMYVQKGTTVWRALWNDKPVVVKRIEKLYVRPIELATLNAVRDVPGFVQLIDVYNVDDALYLIMPEYAGDLFTAIQKAGMSLPIMAIRNIARDIVPPLLYLHRTLRTAHLDIKPENIFQDVNGQYIIGDFGATHYFGFPYEPVGTFKYLPPEIDTDHAVFSEKSDAYSLGLTLYVTAMGHHPRPGDSTTAIIQDLTDICMTRADTAFVQQCIGKWLEPDVTVRASIQDSAPYVL